MATPIPLQLWANSLCKSLRQKNGSGCIEYLDCEKILVDGITQVRGLQGDQVPKEITQAVSQQISADKEAQSVA